MNINIDSAIFIGFLAVNLVVGLYYSQGVKNIREYAIGDRNFSTATIAATIIATWLGGAIFSIILSETYRQGLYFIIPLLGDTIVFLIIGYFLVPRMAEFLGTLSVAEAMGNLYGKNARLITAILGIFGCAGGVAVQFKVSSTILQLFFDISSFYALVASAAVVIIYSAFGGIRAVTFTDVVQFFTFGTIIPIISLIIWGTLSDPYKVFHVIDKNPLFDYKQVLDYSNPKFLSTLSLLLFFGFPQLYPIIFQRISMAKSTVQASKSFFIAAVTCFFIEVAMSWVGVLLIADAPGLDPNDLFAYIINKYTYVGFKGFIAVGVMAMIMSTADSYINSSAVLFAHDFCKPIGLIGEKTELLASRIFAGLIGIIAFIMAFNSQTLLGVALLVWGFYIPIVTVPLLLAIFGFRSTSKTFLIGSIAGFITVFVWRLYLLDVSDSLIPGMLITVTFFIGSHYLLKQSGGWVGIKDDSPLKALRIERKRKFYNILVCVKDFSWLTFCKSNKPAQELTYSFLGIFCIVSIFSTMYSMPQELRHQNKELIEFIYHTVLITSTVFLTYPIWPSVFKKEKFIETFWIIGILYNLVFVSCLLVIISNLGQLQLMIFLLNLMLLSFILRWQVALPIIFIGTFGSIFFYRWSTGVETIIADMGTLQFKIIYSLLLISTIMVAFLKPKQQYQELTEEKNEHLNGRLSLQDKELEDALALKTEFLRNIPHEYHAAMTGVISTSETLRDAYDKLSDKHRKMAIDTIFTGAISLKSFDDNLTTLARLSKSDYVLNKEDIDFSTLTYERVQVCRKYYEENTEDREFILNIEEGVTVNADKGYMIHLLDNLIINAIKYCKKGKISIALSKNSESVNFVISDEGIGIPKTELYDIFKPFAVSSKTRSPAGGRGVGLAVCLRILEVHGGAIAADSDGEKGATFTAVLPL